VGGDNIDIEPALAPLSAGNITLGLTDTGVTPDTYGDATNVPQITVDAKGRITSVVDVPISGGGGGIDFEDGGTPVVSSSTANFTGAGVTVTDVAGVATIDIPGGGGGGSIEVEDDGVTIVAAATKLNFAGAGVVVTDNGSGEALITIAGSGGGGGVPTIVQSKTVGVANLATGITMDAPPTAGNILVAVAFNCTSTASTGVAAGWTALNTSGSTPDPSTMFRVVGTGESATQTPSGSTHGGAIAIMEIAGATVQGNPNSFGLTTGTATTVPFSDDSEFLAVASGLGIGFAGGRTQNTITWNGVFTEEVQGNFASGSTGGVNPGSVSIATFTLNPGGSPAGGITVPSSADIFVAWALFR
jgi:hypothetical protein